MAPFIPSSLLLLSIFALCAAAPLPSHPVTAPDLAPTPPMGWMSWEIFRCEDDCAVHPSSCINEQLYKEQTDALVEGGFLQYGYNSIHIDDCWMATNPPRDSSGSLAPNATRFPSGMAALGNYMHSRNVSFGLYTAESPSTCAGYPASLNHEQHDAATFAAWGVDYLKVDGCGDASQYAGGYARMGLALQSSGRGIVYSCSWPAYVGDDETKKPFDTYIQDGCNLWRNWDDIQCSWYSLESIIDHFGNYSKFLQQFAAPGHWHDPDMLLIGNACINEDEARTQMAIWGILAAPLIMGNDLRKMSPGSVQILQNRMAVQINQDPLGKAGSRISEFGAQEVWSRDLKSSSINNAQRFAIALLNKGETHADITVEFSDVSQLLHQALVRDVWSQSVVGTFHEHYTAKAVPPHGTAYITLEALA